MGKNLRTWLEINKSNFEHNILELKKIIGETKLALVLKSNAYGHGLKEMGQLADSNKNIQWLCTAHLSEALELREYKISKKILVLSYLDSDLNLAIKQNISLVIYDLDTAQKINKAAQELNLIANLHVKIDTGMSRLGILQSQIIDFINNLKKFKNIKIEGIFTHLGDTPNPDQSFSYLQLKRFDKVLEDLKLNKIEIGYLHAFSSSALAIKHHTKYNILRAGAMLYGLWKSESHKNLVLKNYPELNLKPILTWKAKIVNIKNISAGDYIGYDRTYQAKNNIRIAIISVGYFDGLSRSLSNKGSVIINNQEAPIIGIISMNTATIDISNLDNINIDSEVILLGQDIRIQGYIISKKAGIITNEFISRIHNNIIKKIT